MKFKYVFILLILYSNLAFGKYTFALLEDYENVIYSNGLDENSSISLRYDALEDISNLDISTAIRLSKYEIWNSDLNNNQYPSRTINFLKVFKDQELTTLIISIFNGLNYDSLQKTSSGEYLYSDFIEAIANQEIEEKALVFKNRLDYWLNFYNKSTLEREEKDSISHYIMLLAETLHFYKMETFNDREYDRIRKIHFKSTYHSWLIDKYRHKRSKKQELAPSPSEYILLKSKYSESVFNNFGSLIKDEIYFKSLININGLSSDHVDVIYYKKKALLIYSSERKSGSITGGTYLLAINGKRLEVQSLRRWRACGGY